jgi:hypothetical protein
VIAHVAGLPVEEVVPALASWATAGLLLVHTGVRSCLRRSRRQRPTSSVRGGVGADAA